MTQSASGAGVGWLSNLGFAIADDAKAASANLSATSGQGFALSRDDAMSMLNVARQARSHFTEMRTIAYKLTRVTAPADDPGSNSYNDGLVGSGQRQGAFAAGSRNVEQMIKYSEDLVHSLEKALGITVTSDETAAAGLKTTAQDTKTGFAG
ncbi:hypothetical protein [Amycolatopsis panacis]|uniref:PE domain-containing protein n=1 Tax=Amycolatopsis panacis TaxID=2340917 RepID=A0A419HKV8_9PSEU|nr:hypothetical protein [Amycolatopsis panacis]RJQ76453.1 hypothetical protein D5S19_30535 [Amycolatopsis panacis]